MVNGLSKSFRIRSAELPDATRICAIYGFHVADGAGTFEEVAPAAEEIRRRMENVKVRGLPWHVAEAKGELAATAMQVPTTRVRLTDTPFRHRFTWIVTGTAGA